jgi:hypothetical protein
VAITDGLRATGGSPCGGVTTYSIALAQKIMKSHRFMPVSL